MLDNQIQILGFRDSGSQALNVAKTTKLRFPRAEVRA